MKRVKSACLFQTLIFSQKPEAELSKDAALKANRAELAHYKQSLELAKTQYQITDERENADGTITIRVRKQYNNRTDASEYFA
ncbi:MAG: hypothetical protein IJY50_07525 [Clostridia bacterium]|nr:hypothetical protein [Clostridia bacterium]